MLTYITDLNYIPRKEAMVRIERALEEVGLAEEREKRIGAYSRGMRQRLGLAEILVKAPRVAFLDEPTLGLDPEATNRLIALIGQLSHEKRMTVVLSSHLLYQVQKICDRVGIMIGGRLVAQGTLEQLAREKFGVGEQSYSLEEIYLRFFKKEEAI